LKKLFLTFLIIAANAWSMEITPTMRVHQSVQFADDLNFLNLDLAIERQLASYKVRSLAGDIKFGTKIYPRTVLKDSLILLKALTEDAKKCMRAQNGNACLAQFNSALNEQFAIYRPVPKKNEQGYQSEKTTKFTSYYSPDFVGSRTKSKRFKHAIYSKPKEAQHQNYTRVEIDFHGALEGRGYDIFWVEESLFDLYLLHVQGGGRIKILNPDGTSEMKYLSYDGKNNRSFQMIYKYLVQKGYLKAEEATVPNQRLFLQHHPEKEEEVFATCPSYIYFKESNEEPVGLDNIPLTEGRSLAIDRTIYKTMGMINFVRTQKASHIDANGKVVKEPFGRFFIAQDTGGAIKGNARCDLYFGYGPQAELTAYSMNDMGEQYFLVKK
jgi:membrane-bound lytic murein transglycosylase A